MSGETKLPASSGVPVDASIPATETSQLLRAGFRAATRGLSPNATWEFEFEVEYKCEVAEVLAKLPA